MSIYTGIGSRQTPSTMLPIMRNIAAELGRYGYILRSGGADGADAAFEEGCDSVQGKKEIYIPWEGFNNKRSGNGVICHTSPEAFDLAAQYHPAWHRCTAGAHLLHARNGFQVLGKALCEPTDFIICWTPGGYGSGGTGQALRIATAWKIPVFDLGGPRVLEKFDDYLQQVKGNWNEKKR